MNERTLLCLGYGYVANGLTERLARDGWRIKATTRSDEKKQALNAQKISPVDWRGGALDPRVFDDATAILVSTPPGDDGCPAYNASARHIAQRAGRLEWIGYLSTNGVYGDHDGAWVDETSPLRATSARAKNRIRAEGLWRALESEIKARVVIFRLPSIYGPGRSTIDAVQEGRARRIVKPGHVFNRAHVDDIATALRASLDRPNAGALFNIADDEPAPPQDVVAYACELLRVTPPPEILVTAQLSARTRSFYANNKRVSNALMKSALGVRLAYPTYREGLAAIAAQYRAA
ncbi:MAG: SDR family oxidoreductase [Parvularculaceae bacterium]|nr:SDR family oxidoreductase [Parvularculaceae bacterium]